MKNLKIYIPESSKTYDEDGDNIEENRVQLKKALKIMTDDWIDNGHYCAQTVMDMRDAIEELLITIRKHVKGR